MSLRARHLTDTTYTYVNTGANASSTKCVTITSMKRTTVVLDEKVELEFL